ncbi:response regulator [Paenarthrobacter sp. TYUT067]|uniref:hybrid sensor histidine kinase/response regulator n=1 Tax=Paenarthrobacter sp. TYUT067 TaxID=2926245 RepID=UPI00202E3DFD|nr:response regulator [Paenarthrobacter sp. TYUT067]MCM0615321.1 response regulator [Paenarthrobacter sp. TYUT067]
MAGVKHGVIPTRPALRHGWPLFLVPVGVCLVLLAFGLASGSGTTTAQLAGDLAILLAALTALSTHTLAALAGRRNPDNNPGRWFIVAGLAIWSAGQTVWTINGITLNHQYPFPSFADVGFVWYALPTSIGLVLLLKGQGRRIPLRRTILDAGVVASSTFFIAWSSVLGPLAGATGQDAFAQATQMAYPIADVFMVSVVIVLTMRAARGRRLPWLSLGIGFWVLAITDMAYMSFTLQGVSGVTGSPLALGWVLAFLLVALSPLLPEAGTTQKDGRVYAAALELLPYLPVFSAVFFSRSRPIGEDRVLLLTGLVVIVFVMVRQVLIVVENVTLTRDLESKVAERTAELEGLGAIVNSSGDAIIGETPDGVITSWNPGAERIFGYPASEAIGRKGDFFVPQELMENERLALESTAQSGEVQNYESQRRRLDGEVIPVSVTLSPVRGESGIRGVATISRDITERKAAEKELLTAREAALESSRLKSEFLATMSHEIRTPLNAVIGLTSLMMDTPLSEGQRQYAQGVKGAGEVLLTLINDILDFSKLEAGKVDLDINVFDPRALVEEVAGLVVEAAQGKNLELISYCHPDVPARLMGDAGRIRQILLNLSSNAVKFTPTGEVEVQVSVLAQDANNASLRFEVRDTGIGISAENHQRLFESFAQADASTTRRYGGTGLGLAISRRLTEVMGGKIGLDSEPGVGSRFWFDLELPLGPASSDMENLPATLAGRRVLVVDDNATNRLVLETQLASWGMLPVSVADAASALDEYRAAALTSHPYDIAVVDMCMPDTDGLQLARNIKNDANGSGGPGIILLTSTMQVERSDLTSAGIREYLTKPVRSSELYNRLLRVLATKSAGAASPPVLAVVETSDPRPRLGTLLVAEDNEVNQLVARGMANRLGYEVHIVDDGEQAVSAALSGKYAAVLMDCHMPVMDGFDATRAIRARNGHAARIPIIAMTAGALDEDRERCFAAGMDDYISKPVDLAKLSEVLSRWVPQQEQESTAAGGLDAVAAPDAVVDAVAAPDAVVEAAQQPDAVLEAAQQPAEAPASGSVVLDLARLEILRELGPADGLGLLPEAVKAFRQDSQGALDTLRWALDTGHAARVEAAAHKIAGASANIGAAGAAGLCKELERLGHVAGPDLGASGLPILDQLRAELTRVDEALERTLTGAHVREAPLRETS